MGQYWANQHVGQAQINSLSFKLFLRFSHFQVYPQPRKRKKQWKRTVTINVASSSQKKKEKNIQSENDETYMTFL